MIDDASSVTEHRAKGRSRSLAVLLAAVVAMVTIVAGAGAASATAPLPLANPATISATNPGDNIGADLLVTWAAPNPPDNTTGFRLDVWDNGTLTTSYFLSIAGLTLNTTTHTYSFLVKNLNVGHTYQFTATSLNAEGVENTSLPLPFSTGVVAPPKAPTPPTTPGTPFQYATADAAIKQDYEDFLGRQPSFSELVLWETYFQQNPAGCTYLKGGATGPYPVGTLSPADYALYCPNYGAESDLLWFLNVGGSVDNGGTATLDAAGEWEPSNTFAGDANPIIRLYFAFFNRVADYGGLKTWVNKTRNGTSTDLVAGAFAKSSEFVRTYGSLSNADFVTLVYYNVLGRAPDFGGQNYWLNQLTSGRTRGFMMNRFAQSSENKSLLQLPDSIVGTYAAMLYRVPSATELFAERAEIQNNFGLFSQYTAHLIFNGKVRDSVAYAKTARQATPWNPIKAAS